MRVVIEVPGTGGELRVVRKLVTAWATAVAASLEDLPLIATELVSNAVNASPDDGSVIVRLERDRASWSVIVVDEGPGFVVGSLAVPPADVTRGRGLALVNALVDDLDVDRVDGHTVVTARKRVPGDTLTP